MKPVSFKNLSAKEIFLLLLLIGIVTTIPFLGISDFHTKGEPREAIVAYSMLEQNNWILPSNNGGDIPYKPPFFHWCIAAASLLSGGHVTEFSSRLPSAIALIAMALSIFCFYARREGKTVGLLTALITLTAFEIHRAGPNCRVDMMLTALTVGAMLEFYRYYERDLKGVPWLAILLMSLATLTKGPVGSIIPCLCFGVFLLLRKVNFFKAFLLLSAWGLLSFVLPLCWYIAAYQQGGDNFLQLVMEENLGRMTGTMSYDVHINPWYYNLITIAAGYLPWILVVILSLFSLKKIRKTTAVNIGENTRETFLQRLIRRFSAISPVNLFSLVSIAVIFIFYCIPSGKRSVYLMPLYPFIAYFLARYLLLLVKAKSKSLKAFGGILATIGICISALFIAIKFGAISDSIFGHGKHAALNVAMLHEISSIKFFGTVLALLPALLGAIWFRQLVRPGGYTNRLIWGICVLIFGLYFAIDGAFQPRIFAAKSQRTVAAEIEAIAPESAGVLYEYIAEAENAAGDPVHFFELNFYLNDRIHNFLKEQPSEGFLILTEADAQEAIPRFEAAGYQFFPLHETSRPILSRSPGILYRFFRPASQTLIKPSIL